MLPQLQQGLLLAQVIIDMTRKGIALSLFQQMMKRVPQTLLDASTLKEQHYFSDCSKIYEQLAMCAPTLFSRSLIVHMSAQKEEEAMKPESNPIDQIEIVTIGKQEKAAPEQSNPTPAKSEQVQAPEDEEIKAEDEDLPKDEPQKLISRPSMSKLGLKDSHGEKKLREHVESMLSQKHIEQSQQVNSEEEQEDESKSYSAISKSQVAAQPKSEDSGEQRREEVPMSRKCFNKLCSSKKIYKKIRSKVQENKYRFFCRTCYENYYNSRYCQFCEQVYSNTGENEDDDNWIGCDHCERWNHIECERRYRNCNVKELRDKDLLYECLICSQKTKSAQEKAKREPREQGETYQPGKHKIEINRDQRTPIFHKKHESFPNLQYFLQTYSFRLWINEGQIRDDIQSLRSTCLRLPQQENFGKGKYKKVKASE